MSKQTRLTEALRDTRQADWNNFAGKVPPGLILEFGVAGGQSFTRICQTFPERPCYGFDWFRGLPHDWCGKADRGAFSQNGIPPAVPVNGYLVVGLVENTLAAFLDKHPEPVALVHFDMDLYEPTAFALRLLAPRFRGDTILIFDEIGGDEEAYIAHERRAFREFLNVTGFDIAPLGRLTTWSYAFRLIDG